MKKGDLVRIDSTLTLFWHSDYFSEHPNKPIHFIDKEMYYNNIVMFLEFDYTGMYVKILWNDKVGWVNSNAVELLGDLR
jgi:hypothetical protein